MEVSWVLGKYTVSSHGSYGLTKSFLRWLDLGGQCVFFACRRFGTHSEVHQLKWDRSDKGISVTSWPLVIWCIKRGDMQPKMIMEPTNLVVCRCFFPFFLFGSVFRFHVHFRGCIQPSNVGKYLWTKPISIMQCQQGSVGGFFVQPPGPSRHHGSGPWGSHVQLP